MNRLILSTALVAMLGACASTPSTAPATDAKAPVKAANSTSTASAQQSGLPPYKDPKNFLSQKRSVYFDVDEYTVKDRFHALVDGHAKYLNANRDQKIRIEGNTDENGSSEYNLALAQKRAYAVQRIMTLLGVQPNQMEVVSFGEEKPKAAGHDYASWAENRRADIKYGDEK